MTLLKLVVIRFREKYVVDYMTKKNIILSHVSFAFTWFLDIKFIVVIMIYIYITFIIIIHD